MEPNSSMNIPITSSLAPNSVKEKLINFLKNHKIKVIILLVIIIILIVFLLQKNKLAFNNQYYIEFANSNTPMDIAEVDVKQPKYGTDTTISFWINIEYFYDDFRYWRHIFHKGTEVETKKLIKYDEWLDLSNDIKNQFSGVWLSPTQDMLRLCFTTEITNKYEIREHPSLNSLPPTYDIRPDNVLELELEYFDIPNIPMNKLFHICWTVNDRNIEIYLDGKLTYTFVTQGKILRNKGDYYFNFPISYSGFIKNFRHIPYVLKRTDILKLSNE